jgi:hypothetical protein
MLTSAIIAAHHVPKTSSFKAPETPPAPPTEAALAAPGGSAPVEGAGNTGAEADAGKQARKSLYMSESLFMSG